MPMDPTIRKFEKHLKAKLTAEQYEELPTLLEIPDYRWRYLLGGVNKTYNRLGKMQSDEIIALATVLKVHACDLIEEFGLGMSMPACDLRDLVNSTGRRMAIIEHAA